MKILFISMELPYPDHSGGSKYAWQKIRQLSLKNEVFLVSFNEFNEKVQEDMYNKYLKEYYFYNREKKFKQIILQLHKPYSLTSRVNLKMKEKINQLIKQNKFDAIILDSIHMYYNLNGIQLNNIPIYLTQQNIEYKLFESISNKTYNLIKKIIYKIESIKLKNLEEKLFKANKFKGYIFISKDDLEIYKKEIGEVNAICIPPALENKWNEIEKKYENGMIVFSGKMNYEPNVTAVKWFMKNVFCNIIKEIPNAKFYIVGKNPTEEVKQYATKNVIVTGEVEDIAEYLSKAQIVVIPLLSGGGVKLKVFDALSTTNIVITTSKGIEGTCLENGKDLFVTDDEFEFSKKCIENLKQPNIEIAKQGKETLRLNYSFDILQKRLQEFIENN